AVRPRRRGELFAYIVPPSKNYSLLLFGILERGGVEIDEAQAFTANGVRYPDRTAVIRMAQPYGGFAKALLEPQHYPDLRDQSGRPIPPYDVTAHTLSLLMGVDAHPVYSPVHYTKLSEKTSGMGAGCSKVGSPRYALY